MPTTSQNIPPSGYIYLNQTDAIHSLQEVLTLIPKSVREPYHDDAMTKIAMSDEEFVDPLSKFEVQVLACALYNDKMGEPIVYDDVVMLTAKFGRKPMNVPMIYKTIERLIERGMIEEQAKPRGTRSRQYVINENGRAAFRMAILNAALVQQARDQKRVA